MTNQEAPVWLQGRDAIIADAPEQDWRSGKPDYRLSAKVMPRERTKTFEPDQLEAVVERLVQAFELEVSHRRDPSTWVSMATDRFRTSLNGGRSYTAQEVADIGSYSILIGDSEYYRADEETFESQHALFHTALPGGFFWEVLEVLSPPPRVAFTWRHWGDFTGEYKGTAGTGERIEMFGMSLATVDDETKLVEVQHFYNPNDLLAPLAGTCPVAPSGS